MPLGGEIVNTTANEYKYRPTNAKIRGDVLGPNKNKHVNWC